MRQKSTVVALIMVAVIGAIALVGLLLHRKPSPAPPAPSQRADLPRAQLAPAGSPDHIWAQAVQEVYRSAQEIEAQNALEIQREVRYSKLIRGNPNLKQIALTFDDGPHPQYTPQLLAVLHKERVKATFFVVGEMALKYPDLVRAEVKAGHTVSDHTFHHVNLTRVPVDDVLAEWEANRDALRTITGVSPRFCRPPGGDYNDHVIAAAESVGLVTVLWTDDPGDYSSPGAKQIEERTLSRVSNGAIILLHDGIQQTVEVLPRVIQYLKSKGYQFVTVDEMWANLPNRIEPANATQKPLVKSNPKLVPNFHRLPKAPMGRIPTGASPAPAFRGAPPAPTRNVHTTGARA